jgi:IclR family acetate operon transcriptional repressor
MAYLTSEELQALFVKATPPRAYTPNTIIEPDAIEAELERIRQQGYAVDRGERYENWYGAAVPVISPSGETLAAILCGGENEEAARLDLEALAGSMQRVAEELSHRLGRAYD